jgi:hypothetical protein
LRVKRSKNACASIEFTSDMLYNAFELDNLVLVIICTGICVALSINIRIIPNLEDGIVKRIENAVGKDNGFVKNCVDITRIIITCATGLIIIALLTKLSKVAMVLQYGMFRV